MFNKFTKYLASLRFTILLICLLGIMFIIGLWVPQASLMKTAYFEWRRNSPQLVYILDMFGLTTIYTSPITITLWVLFFINLALVLWQRIPVVKHRIALSEVKIVDPATAPGYPFKQEYPLAGGISGEAVLGVLRKKSYAVKGDVSGFYAVKNRLSPIAFMLFHVSFFLILLGGLVSIYTEFVGFVDLAEGESFHGELSRYNADPPVQLPAFGSPPDASFTIMSVTPRVVHNTPTGISVKLADDRGQIHEIGINTPYATENTSFVFKHLGMAPLIVLRDAAGTEVEKALVKLDVLKLKPDRFTLAGYKVTATFYPDFVMENGKRATRSMEFNNPMFFFSVEKDGKKVAEGLVPKSGSLDLAGIRLELKELRHWVRLYVVKQRGVSILYAGFAIACIAVIWRMIFYKREIMGAVREMDGTPYLLVAARSEYYKSLAEDEFTKLFDYICTQGRAGS